MQISQVLQNIESIIFAIVLFFSGFIYGDAPIEISLDYTIPSGFCEYKEGETVEIIVNSENTGRPFKYADHGNDNIDISVSRNNGSYISLYTSKSDSDVSVDGYSVLQIKSSYKKESRFVFTIPEDAPKGNYDIIIDQFGIRKTFENAITVK